MSFRRQRKPRLAERRHGRVLKYSPNRAYVVFHDGDARSMPSAPFVEARIGAEEPFVMIIYRDGDGKVESVSVQRVEMAAPKLASAGLPKVMVKDGRRLTTRR